MKSRTRITPPAKNDYVTVFRLHNEKSDKATIELLQVVLAKHKLIDEFQLMISGPAMECILRPENKQRYHGDFFAFLKQCFGVILYRADP